MRQERYDDQVQEVRNIMHNNLADLSEIELSVLRNRFPISKKNPEPLTLKQVGEQLDLSKERVRQIQKKAITKLREIVEQRLVAI
jgi:RNA polymerase sigma factor (sigma-70 family)